MISNNNNNNTTQLTISYDLLLLLQWLIDHDAEKLKKIITKAVNNGLEKELQKYITQVEQNNIEELQCGVINFFSLLESLLAQAMRTHVEQKAREQNLMPDIDHIDATVCDDATLRHSLEKVTSKLAINPSANARELLFKELLKYWKPQKNTIN